MNTNPAHRFVSECMRCAFEDQRVLRTTPHFFPQPQLTQPTARPATMAEIMVARFTQLGVTVPVANFFGRPIDTLANALPSAPQPHPKRAFVMPPKAWSQAA